MGKRKREFQYDIRLKPSEIGYTQNTIASTINMKTGMKKEKVKLDRLVDWVLKGTVNVDSIKKIEVFRRPSDCGFQWFSLDNRRLWLFKTLQEMGFVEDDFTVECKHVPYDVSECKAKFTTEDNGKTIKVRGFVKPRVKLVGKRRIRTNGVTDTASSDDKENYHRRVEDVAEEPRTKKSKQEDPVSSRRKVKARRRVFVSDPPSRMSFPSQVTVTLPQQFNPSYNPVFYRPQVQQPSALYCSPMLGYNDDFRRRSYAQPYMYQPAMFARYNMPNSVYWENPTKTLYNMQCNMQHYNNHSANEFYW